MVISTSIYALFFPIYVNRKAQRPLSETLASSEKNVRATTPTIPICKIPKLTVNLGHEIVQRSKIIVVDTIYYSVENAVEKR